MSAEEPLDEATLLPPTSSEISQVHRGMSVPAAQLTELVFQLHIKEMELEVRQQQLQATQTQLQAIQTRYHELLNRIPVGFVTLNQRGHIQEINHSGAQLLGASRQYLLGRHFADFLSHGQEALFSAHLHRALQAESQYDSLEEIILDGNSAGDVRQIRCQTTTDLSAAGQPVWHLALLDISEQKKTEQKLRHNEAFLNTIFSSIQDGIVVLAADLTIQQVNPSVQQWLTDPPALAGRKCYEVLCGATAACEECPALRTLQTGRTDSHVLPGPEHTGIGWLEMHTYPIHEVNSNTVTGVILFGRDITERKQLENELERRATHDALTGAYNRLHVEAQITHLMHKANRDNERNALILIDIDHFKAINDRYGHPVGDAVLQSFVVRLARRVRGSDILGRWGGEEFLLLLPNTDAAGGAKLAETIRGDLERAAFPGVGHITASLGVAEHQRGDSQASWIKRADDALYKAKHLGRNRVVVAGAESATTAAGASAEAEPTRLTG